MPKVYFLCTGNACRSQMAEGFAKKLLGRQWQVKSAGIEAHGLNSLAVKVMAEKGIPAKCHNQISLLQFGFVEHF